jgi:hypothetical protein
MAARAALATLIGSDPQINMFGFEQDYVFSSNATDSPPRDRCFVVINWGGIIRSAGGLRIYPASIWFHVPEEIEQDYARIDNAMMRIGELCNATEQIVGEDGWRLTAMSWVGDSPDLFDDGYNTLTRYAQVQCSCRNVA